MKKLIFFIFSFTFLFVFCGKVKADKGDLIYEVQNFTIDNNKIVVSGYALIHETNNYVTVYKRTANGQETSDIIKQNGGQKTKIVIKGSSGQEKEFVYNNVNDNYNFYYQHYYNPTGSPNFSLDTYNNVNINRCDFYKNPTHDNNATKCYYEDIGFKIEIPIDELLSSFSYEEELKFYITAYNEHYGRWSDEEEMRITRINGSSDIIDIVAGTPKGDMKASVGVGLFQKINEQVKYTFNGTATSAITGDTYYIYDLNDGSYNKGFLQGANIGYLGYNFLQNTYSPGKYAVCVNVDTKKDACSAKNENRYCTACNAGTPGEGGVQLVSLFGSWVMFEGTNQLTIELNGGKKCEESKPNDAPLSCNNSKKLESKCDELTVNTSEGSVRVKINQTGNISNVLTPDRTFAGGGFNFGILYQNTVYWEYVGTAPSTSSALHAAVVEEMGNKIYSFNEYKESINISELQFNDANAPITLQKNCFYTEGLDLTDNNYYLGRSDGKKITVSCLFTFPSSKLNYDETVDYNTGIDLGINNKYYTPMKYNDDKFNIKAKITGLSRFKDTAVAGDSMGNPWTGDWDDSGNEYNCEIVIYPLFYKNNPSGTTEFKYNFIYRPIDLNNPFPNRIAGINWFDWYNTSGNPERLSNAYNNLEYTAELDNSTISNIKTYNRGKNYLNWDNIDNGKSSFVDSYVRESGS